MTETKPELKDSAGSKLEASFSMLLMSLASAAAMGLGLSPHPQTNQVSTDLTMAKFNIDLLVVLKEKTTGNLNTEENHFLETVLYDLQLKYVAALKPNSK